MPAAAPLAPPAPAAAPGPFAFAADWPWAYRAGWAVVALGAAAVGYGLFRFWSAGADTFDRAVILAAAGWAAARLRPHLAALPARPRPAVGFLLVLAGAVWFQPGWFVLAQVGPRPVVLWWTMSAVLLAAAGLILAGYGWRHLNALRFPLLFPLLALPIPGRINNPLQTVLQEWTTSLAAAGLSAAGETVRREGFVLFLPSGPLGVVEACSGIRSLTALTAIAVFLAHVRGFGPARGLATVALAVPVIVLVNGLRVVITGVMQEQVGRNAVTGWRHELLGYAMILLGLAVVAGLTRLLAGGRRDADPVPDTGGRIPAAAPGPRGGWPPAVVLAGGLAAGLAALLLPPVARTAVPDGNAPLADIPTVFAGAGGVAWTGADQDIDPEITDMLAYSRAVHRVYRSPLGYEVAAWVLYWTSAQAVKDYHHPDVCMPSRGMEVRERRTESVATPGGRTVPVTYREFERGAADRMLIAYWTQEGRRVWTPADETAAFDFLFSVRWVGRRVGRDRPADEFDDRLIVLLGTRAGGSADVARSQLFDVTGRLADGLYTVCPWADPK